MLGYLVTWMLRCTIAHVDCSKHCALPYNQLLSHSCPLCYNSWRIRHIVKKNMTDSTLCLCNVIFSIAQKFLCVGLAMCISNYMYDCCVFAVNQGVFAVHATFGPLHRGGSRQWNQEVLCLTQPPSSCSTQCRGIWQCKESSSHSAAALLQCRETRHAQNVPPLSHSGAAAAGLFCQSLTWTTGSFLFSTSDLHTAVFIDWFVLFVCFAINFCLCRSFFPQKGKSTHYCLKQNVEGTEMLILFFLVDLFKF